MKKTVSGRLLGAGAASFAMGVALLSGPAAAQDIANDGAVEGDTIVVTGSRIARYDVDAPVPVSVVSSTDLQYDAAPNIQDTRNEMPQVAIGLTRTNSNFLISGTGVATIDLRGLGDSRTLVLVNGRRLGTADANTGNPNPSPNLDQVPTPLIERVDVVTGGARVRHHRRARRRRLLGRLWLGRRSRRRQFHPQGSVRGSFGPRAGRPYRQRRQRALYDQRNRGHQLRFGRPW